MHLPLRHTARTLTLPPQFKFKFINTFFALSIGSYYAALQSLQKPYVWMLTLTLFANEVPLLEKEMRVDDSFVLSTSSVRRGSLALQARPAAIQESPDRYAHAYFAGSTPPITPIGMNQPPSPQPPSQLPPQAPPPAAPLTHLEKTLVSQESELPLMDAPRRALGPSKHKGSAALLSTLIKTTSTIAAITPLPSTVAAPLPATNTPPKLENPLFDSMIGTLDQAIASNPDKRPYLDVLRNLLWDEKYRPYIRKGSGWDWTELKKRQEDKPAISKLRKQFHDDYMDSIAWEKTRHKKLHPTKDKNPFQMNQNAYYEAYDLPSMLGLRLFRDCDICAWD